MRTLRCETFLATKSSLKMIKNAFYFTLKALFVLKIFKFLPLLFGHVDLVNQTMEFGQLIEYNMRKIFLEKPYAKCGGGTIPRSFSKKPKLSISLDQKSNYCMLI